MNKDPFGIDNTNFASYVQIRPNPLRFEPSHPLSSDQTIALLSRHLEDFRGALLAQRKPAGEMNDDAYFQFNEGLELRTEIIVKILIEYIKEHPEIIA